MSDLIKREDAIKAVAQDLMYESCVESEYASDELSDWIEVAKDILEDVPSADRPQGEWVKHDDERDYCSRCKHIFKTRTITQQDKWTLYIDDLGYNYCPNCGAQMKGADDEV